MYKIGELSKLCKLPVKTLRYYDSVGLLCPDRIDYFTGYRYYSAAKLSDCYRILSLKELGFSLEEIRAQMNMPQEELQQLINAKLQELERLQMQTEQRIKRLCQISKSVEEDQTMFNVVVRENHAIRTVYVKVLGKWIVCDLLKEQDDFVLNVPNPRFPKEALFWTSVEFLKDGKVRNTFQNGDVFESPVWCWVTGNVICVPRKTASINKHADPSDAISFQVILI